VSTRRRGQDTRVTGRYTGRKRQGRPPSYWPVKVGKGRTVNVAVIPKRDPADQWPVGN
jgi:hypothetical protein